MYWKYVHNNEVEYVLVTSILSFVERFPSLCPNFRGFSYPPTNTVDPVVDPTGSIVFPVVV